MSRRQVVTHHLEMRDPTALRASRTLVAADLARVARPSPELGRFLYRAVGGDWFWIDRLSWSRQRWLAWLGRAEVETWVASIGGAPAGYFELERQPGASVEIVYFGVFPDVVGQGLGGWLLTRAVERAWALGAARVWVHTCSLDHPAALANYLARGFTEFKTEQQGLDLPATPPSYWPPQL